MFHNSKKYSIELVYFSTTKKASIRLTSAPSTRKTFIEAIYFSAARQDLHQSTLFHNKEEDFYRNTKAFNVEDTANIDKVREYHENAAETTGELAIKKIAVGNIFAREDLSATKIRRALS